MKQRIGSLIAKLSVHAEMEYSGKQNSRLVLAER